MGYNTTVVVMNDALHAIEKDPEFGKKLAQAVTTMSLGREALKKFGRIHDLDVSAPGHVNAATVIESHHADRTVVVAIGGNYGTVLGETHGYKHHEQEDRWRILEEVLDASIQIPRSGNETSSGLTIHSESAEPSEVEFLRWLVRSTIDGPPITDEQFEAYLSSMKAVQKQQLSVPLCKKCGSDLIEYGRKQGRCSDETCPYSDRQQHETYTEG